MHILKVLICLLLFSHIHLQIQAKPKSNAVDSTKTRYSFDNCINKFSMDKTVKTDAGYQFWFVDQNLADGKTLKLSVVEPHKSTHAPHTHPDDEIFYILEGNAEVYLNGQWKTIEQNSSFYCPSNMEHGIRNVSSKILKYLVIKKYEKK